GDGGVQSRRLDVVLARGKRRDATGSYLARGNARAGAAIHVRTDGGVCRAPADGNRSGCRAVAGCRWLRRCRVAGGDAMRRLLPMPVLSFALWVLWLLMANS